MAGRAAPGTDDIRAVQRRLPLGTAPAGIFGTAHPPLVHIQQGTFFGPMAAVSQVAARVVPMAAAQTAAVVTVVVMAAGERAAAGLVAVGRAL